jgi:hypothetical protein
MRKFYLTTEYWLTLLIAGYWLWQRLAYMPEVLSGLYIAYVISRTLFKQNRGLMQQTALLTSEFQLLIAVQGYLLYTHGIRAPWLLLANHAVYLLSRGLVKHLRTRTQTVYQG